MNYEETPYWFSNTLKVSEVFPGFRQKMMYLCHNGRMNQLLQLFWIFTLRLAFFKHRVDLYRCLLIESILLFIDFLFYSPLSRKDANLTQVNPGSSSTVYSLLKERRPWNDLVKETIFVIIYTRFRSTFLIIWCLWKLSTGFFPVQA